MNPSTNNRDQNNKLEPVPQVNRRTSKWQYSLSLEIEKQVERRGIWMGVLSDGTPFLSQAGLAELCGRDARTLRRIESEWESTQPGTQISTIKELLSERGAEVNSLYISINHNGVEYHAYPDYVCLAILEYFAFDSPNKQNKTALSNFRKLAGTALREMIYFEVGYDPRNTVPPAWIQFKDRMSLLSDSVPAGYFSIFKEIADVIVTLILSGAKIGTEFIPDISVGLKWAKYWKDNSLSSTYGTDIKYSHNYPDYFPQSKSNPQSASCYPESALPEFRRWMRTEYLPEDLPRYLEKQVSQGKLTPAFADLAITGITNKIGGYIE